MRTLRLAAATALLGGALSLILPAAVAGAATVSLYGTSPIYLLYSASRGEVNDLTVSGTASTPVFHDTAGITAGTGCDQIDIDTASCTGTQGPFQSVTIRTSDLPDIVHIDLGLRSFIEGQGGNDQLFGGPGVDSFEGGPGADLMSGGGGSSDVVSYLTRTTGVDVSLDGVANDGEPGEGDNVLPDVENVQGSNYNDTLIGDGRNNYLYGGFGDDTLKGLGGDDRLDGHNGNDIEYGGAGDDRVLGGDGPQGSNDDLLFGQGGDDEVDGQYGNDRELGGAGADQMVGSYGADDVVGGPGTDSFSGGPGADTLNSADQGTADSVTCGSEIDTVTADAADTVDASCESVTIG